MPVSAYRKGDGIRLDVSRAGYVGPKRCKDTGQHPFALASALVLSYLNK